MTEPKPAPRRRWLSCLAILGMLLVLLALGGYILIGTAPAPTTTTAFTIDLAEIRRLAASGQPLPLRLNALLLGEGTYPQAVVFAGGSFQSQRMSLPVFQIAYENSTVIVDSGMPESDFHQMFGDNPFDAKAYEKLQQAMLASQSILVTHTHDDHAKGIASPNLDQLASKVSLNQEQLDSLDPEIRPDFKLLQYDQYDAFAPGVVLIKSPGHSTGDQMIYVQLQNGNEYLLVGDVVWNMKSVERLSGRPLIMRIMMREDWDKSSAEISALHALTQTEPNVHLVVSHDAEQLSGYLQQGILGNGFE